MGQVDMVNVGRWRALTLLAVALVLSMTTWFSASAVIPQLRQEWSLTDSAAAWLTIAVQLGFVCGALVSSFLNLSDVVSPRRVILGGSGGCVCQRPVGDSRWRGLRSAVALRDGILPGGRLPAGLQVDVHVVQEGTRTRARSLGGSDSHRLRDASSREWARRAGLLATEGRTATEQRETSPVAPLLVPGFESLPPKVHAVITSRLARLSPQDRELVGLAATVGRAFTFEVLAGANDRDEEHVASALDELWQRHVVRQHGADSYDFGHDKLREVAYAEVSPARRRLLHRKVAGSIEKVYASDPESVSGQFAAHYRQAGLPEQAIRYYQRAGELALRLSAYEEATAYLTRGLELLEPLPDTPERSRQELGTYGVLFLASDEAAFVTGAGLVIDGGYSQRHSLVVRSGG